MRTNCKLCKVKRVLWETNNFFGVRCIKHFVPLIVLKDHRKEITETEKEEVLGICKSKYPKLFFDNTVIDSNEHWHIHLCKKNRDVSL